MKVGTEYWGEGGMAIADRVATKRPPQEFIFEQDLKKAREQAVLTMTTGHLRVGKPLGGTV